LARRDVHFFREPDVPDTEVNAAAFGYPGSAKDGSPAAYPNLLRNDEKRRDLIRRSGHMNLTFHGKEKVYGSIP
jgi:hypothetical protein